MKKSVCIYECKKQFYFQQMYMLMAYGFLGKKAVMGLFFVGELGSWGFDLEGDDECLDFFDGVLSLTRSSSSLSLFPSRSLCLVNIACIPSFLLATGSMNVGLSLPTFPTWRGTW